MTDEELKLEYRALWEAIYVSDCYGVEDIARFYMVEDELRRRGYDIYELRTLMIKRARRP